MFKVRRVSVLLSCSQCPRSSGGMSTCMPVGQATPCADHSANGELDPLEEQGFNLNSALFTLGEGSRQTHEKGNVSG